MAEVELSDPIGALRGDLRKRGDLYARMLYGKCVETASDAESVWLEVRREASVKGW